MATIFDIFGKGGSKSFYMRDFKNAYKFRPDVNPVRQKFQGYVNFILNRDLFRTLYDGEPESVGEYRTTISSLVRTAELPSVKFNTEVKRSYNSKKIVNTGIEYDPVSITVYDTVGNEWLMLLMKYFAYHYMDPRNKGEEGNRDVNSAESRETIFEFVGSKFAEDLSKFNSNASGYNINKTPHFFERIDYILYHGNKGIQYSLLNPVLTTFKPNAIDYTDSGFMDFQLNFEYEKFVVYDKVNFTLTDSDFSRFENVASFTGPAFAADEQELLSLTERDLAFLGNSESPRQRSGQDVADTTASDDTNTNDTTEVDENGNPVETQDQAVDPAPDGNDVRQALDRTTEQRISSLEDTIRINQQIVDAPEGEFSAEDVAAAQQSLDDQTRRLEALKAGNPEPIDQNQSPSNNTESGLPSTYRGSATMAQATKKEEKGSIFSDILGQVADRAITAAIHGNSIKDAVVNTAVGAVTSLAIETFTADKVTGGTTDGDTTDTDTGTTDGGTTDTGTTDGGGA